MPLGGSLPGPNHFRPYMTGSHTGGPCLFRNRELEMKSLVGAISPNRESSEHADEQIREKRE